MKSTIKSINICKVCSKVSRSTWCVKPSCISISKPIRSLIERIK